MAQPKLKITKCRVLYFTFCAVVGGFGEQALAVIGAFEAPLDAAAETDVVLALRRRDGEAALLLHGEVRVRVRVLTWKRKKGEGGKEGQRSAQTKYPCPHRRLGPSRKTMGRECHRIQTAAVC